MEEDMEEIRSLEKQYKKLEELYAIKLIPDYRKIEESIESLKICKYHKKYPFDYIRRGN